jgi:hypothetical protein
MTKAERRARDKKHLVALDLSADLYAWLCTHARQAETSVPQLIRDAIVKYRTTQEGTPHAR